MEYTGSFDVVPEDDLPPGAEPAECSLCAASSVSWWYVVEPAKDSENLITVSIALARWWAICASCHGLVDAGAVDQLQGRVAGAQGPHAAAWVAAFVRQARRWGEVAP